MMMMRMSKVGRIFYLDLKKDGDGDEDEKTKGVEGERAKVESTRSKKKEKKSTVKANILNQRKSENIRYLESF